MLFLSAYSLFCFCLKYEVADNHCSSQSMYPIITPSERKYRERKKHRCPQCAHVNALHIDSATISVALHLHPGLPTEHEISMCDLDFIHTRSRAGNTLMVHSRAHTPLYRAILVSRRVGINDVLLASSLTCCLTTHGHPEAQVKSLYRPTLALSSLL